MFSLWSSISLNNRFRSFAKFSNDWYYLMMTCICIVNLFLEHFNTEKLWLTYICCRLSGRVGRLLATSIDSTLLAIRVFVIRNLRKLVQNWVRSIWLQYRLAATNQSIYTIEFYYLYERKLFSLDGSWNQHILGRTKQFVYINWYVLDIQSAFIGERIIWDRPK